MTAAIVPNGLVPHRGTRSRTYFRQGDSVFFTFLFPLVMLTIFSVAFSEQSLGRTAGNGGQRRDLLPARHARRRACC